MISFEINHSDSKALLQNMATELNITYNGEDFIIITPPIGNGIIKVLTIGSQLQVIMGDVTFTQDLFAKLQFDDVKI